MESIDSLIEAIEVFDGAVIIVTHSELMLEALATKLIVYDNDTITVFDGTYLDFLERVGWSDEGGVRVKKGKKQAADTNVNRKDSKKQRAAIISDKSKVLSSLKARIAAIEEEITKLEQSVEQDTQALLEASVAGKALTIKQLSQSVNEAKAGIEKLFAELEEKTEEHDAKSREFDQQLNELAQIS